MLTLFNSEKYCPICYRKKKNPVRGPGLDETVKKVRPNPHDD